MSEQSPTIIQKPIPTTIKFLFVSVGLGISAMVMVFLSGLTDSVQARWLNYMMYIFFIFSNLFTVLAISSYFSEIRGK